MNSLAVFFATLAVLMLPPGEGEEQMVHGPTQGQIQKFLDHFGSPLPAVTIYSFRQSHPDFDTVGYLTVMRAESQLGTTGGSATYNNPGNIKWRDGGTEIWHKLATGRWHCAGQGWYNVYPTMYAGQRAAIRLIYEFGYNDLLAKDDWWGFANRYYGANVPGIGHYVRNLEIIHAQNMAWFPRP